MKIRKPTASRTPSLAASLAALLIGASNASAALTWNSAGPSNLWSTAAGNENWTASALWTQNESAIFDATSGTPEAIDVSTANIFNDITFDVSGFSITSVGAGNFTLSDDLASTISVTNAGHTASISKAIANSLNGASSLTKSGLGTLILNATNTFSGVTTITAGTLQLGDGTAPNDGTLANSLSIVNNAALVYNRFGSINYGGVISGTGTVTKTGPGTQTLTGNNTYTGVTTVSTGTLNATITPTVKGISTGPASIAAGSTLILNNTNITATAPVIANAFTGSGLLKLQFFANTTARNTTMNNVGGFNGTIQLSTSGSTGDKWNAANIGTVTAPLTIDSGCQLYVNGTPSTFSGGITVSGTGNSETRGAIRLGATLNANVSLVGNTTIGGEAGILNGNITTTVAGNVTLTLGTANSTGGGTLTGNISNGAGTLALSATRGPYTLTGANTYTGKTTIGASGVAQIFASSLNSVNGGTPLLASSSLGAPTSVANGTIDLGGTGITAALEYTGTGETTDRVINISGTIANPTLTQSGTGLLKFTSDLTATGVGGKTLILTGSTAGSGEISGAIGNIFNNGVTLATTTTAAFTTTATTITVNSATGVVIGATISGTGFTGGQRITSITGAAAPFTIGLSAVPNAAGTLGQNVTFTAPNALTKSGTGTWSLSGPLSFTGPVSQSAGTLVLSGNNSFTGPIAQTGGTLVLGHPSALGVTTNLTTVSAAAVGTVGATVDLATDTSVNAYPFTASSNNPTTFLINRATPGAGITHNVGTAAFGNNTVTFAAGSNVTSGTAAVVLPSLNLTAGNANSLILNPTTATVSITGATNIGTNNFAKTLNLGGTNTGNSITGDISNGLNTLSLIKSNTSTWILSGNNTFTGVTSVTGGTLRLNYNPADSSKLSDTAALVLGGGTLELTGGTHTETVASTTLAVGSTSTVISSGGTLHLKTVTANAGAIVLFGANNIALTDSLNVNGILPWARVWNGSAYVYGVNSTNLADGPIVAFSSYADISRLGGVIANGLSNQVRIIEGGSSGNVTLAANPTLIGSLLVDASGGATTVDLAGGTLSVGDETGGTIWQTATSGGLTLSAGTLTTGNTDNATAALLTLQNDSVTQPITIASNITNNGTDVVGLSKLGAGLVTLNGTNSFSGALTVGAGTLKLGGSASLGAASSVAVSSGALLDLNGTNQSVTLAAGNGVGTVANNSGSGTSVLTLTGTPTINASHAIIRDNTDSSNGKVAVVITGNTQPLNNANTYSGGTTVNGGGYLYLLSSTPSAAGTGPINLTAAGTGLPNNTGSGLVVDGATYANDITGAGYVHNNTNATASTTVFTGNINTSGPFLFRAGTTIVYNFAGNGTTSVLSGVIGSTTSQVNGAVATGGIIKSGTGTLTLSGANVYSGTTTVREGVLNLSGARTGSSGIINVSDTAGLSATLNISNGTYAMAALAMNIGNAPTTAATGTVNQTGGAISFTGGNQLLVGQNTVGNQGIYNMSGGSITTITSTTRGIMLGVNTNPAPGPASGGGTFNLSGTGTLNMTAASGGTGDAMLEIGRSDAVANNTTNVFNQTGGTANVGILAIGGAASAGSTGVSSTLTLTAGTFSANQFTLLAAGGTNTAVINIGGTADVTLPAFPTVRGVGSTATLNFNGGTLRPLAASATYLGGLNNAFVKAGGASFDVPTGRDITVSQALLTDTVSTGGGLTKSGSGTLTLTGVNTYTGNTTVSLGTLSVANPNFADASTVSVATGAVLNLAFTGTDTVGSLVLNGVVQAPGVYTSANTGGLITGTGSITTGPTFTSFKTDNFSVEEQGEPLISGPDADPDGDGVSNLLEYAFKTNPRVAGRANLPVGSAMVDTGSSYVGCVYTRLKGASDLTFTPQFDSALPFNIGTLSTAVTIISVVNNGNGTETVTLRDNTPVTAGGKRFVRILVTTP